MSAPSGTPVCEIRGCGKPAAVVMRALADQYQKEHFFCYGHAWWMSARLGKAGVSYTFRPMSAA